MELLEKDSGTAAEVAYRVGFGSPAYFNKCFTAYYGVTPGEVKKIESSESIKKLLPHKKAVNPDFVNPSSKQKTLTGFWEEMKRRNVFRAGFVYVLLAWLFLQSMVIAENNFLVPSWIITSIMLMLLPDLPIALYLVWRYEKYREGFARIDEGKSYYYNAFMRNYDIALAYYEKANQVGNEVVETDTVDQINIAYIYLKKGKTKEGYKLLNHLFEKSQGTRYDHIWKQAEIYAAMGNQEKALEKIKILEQLNPYWGRMFSLMPHYHVFEGLYENPEFQAIIKRVDKKKAKIRQQIDAMEKNLRLS